MKIFYLSLVLAATPTFAQQTSGCSVFFNDDFSTASNWTMINSGGTTLDGSSCLISAYCSVENKVYQTLPDTLPNNMWRAQTDFHLLGVNSFGNGTGGYAIALTAGNQDFMSEPLGGGAYYETNQDGLAVIVNSNPLDNEMQNWYFLIEAKKGTARVWDLNLKIPLVAGVFDYYIVFERTSNTTSKLSVFSDIARSQHIPGSPVIYMIEPSITGLNTIQHAASTPGNAARYFNARFDNDFICLPLNALKEPISGQNTLVSALVFPNPVANDFEIQLSDHSTIEEISLTDVSGKQVAVFTSSAGSTNQFQFPESLNNGTYFIEITTTDHQHLLTKIQKFH